MEQGADEEQELMEDDDLMDDGPAPTDRGDEDTAMDDVGLLNSMDESLGLFGYSSQLFHSDAGSSCRIVAHMGGSTSNCRSQLHKEFKATVSEVYSPPRVAKAAALLPRYGSLPGFPSTSRVRMMPENHGTLPN